MTSNNLPAMAGLLASGSAAASLSAAMVGNLFSVAIYLMQLFPA